MFVGSFADTVPPSSCHLARPPAREQSAVARAEVVEVKRMLGARWYLQPFQEQSRRGADPYSSTAHNTRLWAYDHRLAAITRSPLRQPSDMKYTEPSS